VVAIDETCIGCHQCRSPLKVAHPVCADPRTDAARHGRTTLSWHSDSPAGGGRTIPMSRHRSSSLRGGRNAKGITNQMLGFAQSWSAGTPRSTCSPQPATNSYNSLRSAVESDGSNNTKSTSTTNPQVSREPGAPEVLDRRRSARRARAGGSTDAIVGDKCGFARIAGARRGHARALREQWCRGLHRASRAV